MSSLERLGLLAFSAGVSALIVALVLPYTDPESLAVLSSHPLGAKALNISTAAIHGLARLLEGVSSSAPAPSLRLYHPLLRNASSSRPRAGGGDPANALDWSDPEVWRLQQQQITGPFYTESEVAHLLHWCDDGRVNDSTSTAAAGDGRGSGVVVASTGPDAAAAARFDRLARWVAANGGDASKVQLGFDGNGVRGLHAAAALAAGEVALSIPLKVGLSAATFRAARVLAGPTASWRNVEDADLFLDALALSYEVSVHGERSPWADYLCLLPRSYGGLPMHISDPWVASMLSELPSLRRLASKRRAQLALFGNDLVRPAVATLPGGRAAMSRLLAGSSKPGERGTRGEGAAAASSGRDLWQVLWHWAYAAAKTRGVALSADELREGGGGAPLGEELPLRLPLAMLEWVQEFGVMLPILDMANHAFEGRGANVAYQLISDAPGTGLAAALIAREPIAAGQPLLFDYVGSAEVESGPACLDRWLVEYGFVPETGADPLRDCDTFDVTATDVARAVFRASASDTKPAAAVAAAASPAAATDGPVGQQNPADARAMSAEDSTSTAILEQQIRERLSRRAKDGLPGRLEIHVRQPYEGSEGGQDHVGQRWAVLQWLTAALREPQEGHGGGGSAAAGALPSASSVLRALLQARWEQLGSLEQQAQRGKEGRGTLGDTGRGQEAACTVEEGGSREVRAGLAAVAAAGRRAVRRALEHELTR